MIGPADAAWISATSDDGWFGLLLGPVAIAHVAIQTIEGTRETMWEIAGPQVCNEPVRRVQYGVVPAGFTEVVAPRVLSEGAHYELELASCDYDHGILAFVIANGYVQPDNA